MHNSMKPGDKQTVPAVETNDKISMRKLILATRIRYPCQRSGGGLTSEKWATIFKENLCPCSVRPHFLR
ncbi:MAG: hypothetical protein AB7H77_06640 [Bdellovibrionales bacterium]